MFGNDGDDNAGQPATAATAGQIYGAKVESEMSLKTIDFPIETASFDEKSDLSADEVEKVVREAGTDLSDGAIQVASLHYVDPQRFGDAFAESMAGPMTSRSCRRTSRCRRGSSPTIRRRHSPRKSSPSPRISTSQRPSLIRAIPARTPPAWPRRSASS
ncbi:hypothetical protein AJ88_43830 [Mesorhizobium amorphae CCBAU 01583]|nr:hypothetical protein AJ88_43830 [Mesorhizobium amorphae CCBAU 01583]